jgi:hypothetical protein
MIKLQKVDPKATFDRVLDKHFATIKDIQKTFIDSSEEDFKKHADYAPLLAWASQFILLCKDT